MNIAYHSRFRYAEVSLITLNTPTDLKDCFNGMHVLIHGIDEHIVKGSPTFSKLLSMLRLHIEEGGIALLTSLILRNFRCFEEHTVELNPLSIVVGRNNAGKTTIAEALRLVAVVSARYQSLAYNKPPDWLALPARFMGCKPSLDGLQIRFDSIFHRYADPPALVRAEFEEGVALEIHIGGEKRAFVVVFDSSGGMIRSKAQALRTPVPSVSILPQVAPVSRTEYVLRDEYVRSSMGSALAPLHFRNQLRLLPQHLQEFRTEVEATWPGLQIQELRLEGEMGKKQLFLDVRDRDFVGELAVMGHGLQMWMQTIWFIVRSRDATTAVLDEPDVYMHADLQRQLIRLVKDRFPQVIIMTHSTEIISEVQPSEIVIVDRTRRFSRSATSLPAVQRVVSSLGSIHNIGLARLYSSRVLLIVEGKDLSILKQLHDKLFPRSPVSLDTIPFLSIGGWGGWKDALGSALLLHNALGEEITVHCILDSDYHTPEQVDQRRAEASSRGIKLHVWGRKEIESYLLVPSTIARFVRSKCACGTQAPTEQDVAAKLDVICSRRRDEIFDRLAQEFLVSDKAGGATRANQRARALLEKLEKEPDGLLSRVLAKAVIRELSTWSQSEFGVSLSTGGLVRALEVDEIHQDIMLALTQIETDRGQKFGEALGSHGPASV